MGIDVAQNGECVQTHLPLLPPIYFRFLFDQSECSYNKKGLTQIHAEEIIHYINGALAQGLSFPEAVARNMCECMDLLHRDKDGVETRKVYEDMLPLLGGLAAEYGAPEI